VDNAVSPQTVEKNVLLLWHSVICETGKLTSVPVFLNTFFDIRDEPLVSSSFDTICTFFPTGLDALVMGDFLALKQGGKRG
jgi:carbamoyltransferase